MRASNMPVLKYCGWFSFLVRVEHVKVLTKITGKVRVVLAELYNLRKSELSVAAEMIQHPVIQTDFAIHYSHSQRHSANGLSR